MYVEGRLQTRSYDDKDGKKVWATDVVADQVILLGGRGEGSGGVAHDEGFSQDAPSAGMKSAPRGRMAAAPAAPAAPMSEGITDDDVPF